MLEVSLITSYDAVRERDSATKSWGRRSEIATRNFFSSFPPSHVSLSIGDLHSRNLRGTPVLERFFR